MRDFTVTVYAEILKTLLARGFSFQPFAEFVQNPEKKVTILRHDVDKLPENSLKTAQMEASLGIRGSYYFRTVPCSYNEEIIKEIARLGHEVGYHYETMDTARSKVNRVCELAEGNGEKSKRSEDPDLSGLKDGGYRDDKHSALKPDFKMGENEGHIDAAYEEFCEKLEMLRGLVPVKTICMHGSPQSAYDNKDIWNKYDYRALGIIGEPYFDVDFDKVFYLTDTGRRWNGYKVSVRDKMPQQERWNKEGLTFKTATDIINAANSGRLPNQIMITVHPQRWSDEFLPWIKELVMQNAKNVVKWGLIRMRQ